MYEFYYNKLQPYWKQSIQLHYMDTDSLFLSFDTNHQELINFLQENKDEIDFNELHTSHELYDPINKKVKNENSNKSSFGVRYLHSIAIKVVFF